MTGTTTSSAKWHVLHGCTGVGPFTAANMLQLLGHYSRIPCDSETVRHLHKVHNLQSCTLANVQHHAQQVGWTLPHSCTHNTHAIGLCFY